MSDKCVEISSLSLFAIAVVDARAKTTKRCVHFSAIRSGHMFSRIKALFALIRQLDADYGAVKERIHNSPGLPLESPTVSFWSVPQAELPFHNDAILPSHVDIVVIGSGITGVSC